MKKEDEKIFELHNYLDVIGSPEEIIEKIVRDIPNLEDIGFAGYLEKKWLKIALERLILDQKGDNQPYSYNAEYRGEVETLCKNTIRKCENYLDGKIHIFLFPTFDEFVIKRMNGVSGFCPWRNTIFLFINFNSGWRKYLKESLIHELAHALSPYAKLDASIGHLLVLEGLAENFKDFIIPGKRSSWTKAISEDESWKMLNEIKDILEENDFEEYNEVFYGTGKYPMWSGYTVGYYLVKKYLQKQKEINWNKLLRKDLGEILCALEIS